MSGGKMDYFIDTNVAIAYSFFLDKHHISASNFFSETNDDIYWSNNVFREYEDIYYEIFEAIEFFFDKVFLELLSSDEVFLNKYSFEKFVLINTKQSDLSIDKKLKLIDIFWEEILSGIFQEKMNFIKYFENFSNEISFEFIRNKNYLLEKINLYDCGLDNYKKYVDLLKLLLKSHVHKPDYKIILDAHDFARDTLAVFVTFDKKLFNAVKGIDKLNIDGYRLLN